MIWIITAVAVMILAGSLLLVTIQVKRKSPYGRTDFEVSALLMYYNLTTKPGREISLAKQRAKLEADLRTAGGPLRIRVAGIRDTEVKLKNHTIPVRIYNAKRPRNGRKPPLMIYFHGGGFAIGSISAYDQTARLLAARTGAIVISAGYRLAPEARFPAAVQDSYAVLKWTARQAVALGGDPARIMLCGDSAGGNLVAVVCQLSRDKHGPPISHQILLYPWTNLASLETASFERFKTGYILTGKELEDYRRHYLETAEQHRHPYASPALAKDLSRLPPAIIITAGFDPLLDDGEAYSAALRTAGNKVSYLCQLGSVHGFMSMRGLLKKQVEATMKFILKNLQ